MKKPKDPRTNRPPSPPPTRKTHNVTALENRVTAPEPQSSPKGPPMPKITGGPKMNLGVFRG